MADHTEVLVERYGRPADVAREAHARPAPPVLETVEEERERHRRELLAALPVHRHAE